MASKLVAAKAAPAAASKAPAPVAVPEDAGWPSFPRINVGGVEFQTSLTSLRSQPGSLLSAIFTGEEECDTDNFGRVFFDRDGTHFATVLNFMRTGDVVGVPATASALELLRREGAFYRLPALLALLPPAHPSPTPAGGVVHRKWLAAQEKQNGDLAIKLVNAVAGALNLGAELGYNTITLTAFRPPETIGLQGLPPVKMPAWGETETMYCWGDSFAVFFIPQKGFPVLHATRDYFMYVLRARGFSVKASFSDEEGILYDISSTESH